MKVFCIVMLAFAVFNVARTTPLSRVRNRSTYLGSGQGSPRTKNKNRSPCPKCENPSPVQEIDWNMMAGDWYEAAHADSPMDALFTCAQRTIYGPNDNGGFNGTISFENMDGVHESMNTFAVKRKDENCYVEVVAKEDAPADVFESMVKTGMGIKDKNGDELTPKISFYTDYDNYLLVLVCDPKGRMDLWYLDRKQQPTDEDMDRVECKLKDIGHGWEDIELTYVTCC